MTGFDPREPDFANRVRDSFARQPFMATIGAELTDVAPGRCEIRLPYDRTLTQQHGFFHGGVIATIADNAAGYAAFSLMPAESSVLTVEFKLNIVAPGRGEALLARASVLRPGRTLTAAQIHVYAVADGVETLCAAGLETLMCLPGVCLPGRDDGPAGQPAPESAHNLSTKESPP